MRKPGKKYPYNTLPSTLLMQKIQSEQEPRVTLSFYRYARLANLEALRETLYLDWSSHGVLGRVYIASEGVNAQISVPLAQIEAFKRLVEDRFPNMTYRTAVEERTPSFYKLKVKIRRQIVADGLDEHAYDLNTTGKHLNALEWHQALDHSGAICIDMRNYYESEVGHFKNAVCPDVATFREQLPKVLDDLKGQEDKKILLYCTGGIRCEKASSYLIHHGFRDVNQLNGGIIGYTQQIRDLNIESQFKGKNFVFDGRLGERVTDDVIASCHQCGASCDNHRNCANDLCHRLFIQCEPCEQSHNGCCSGVCSETLQRGLTDHHELMRVGEADTGFKSRRKLTTQKTAAG